ncbi:MAG: hypothetical protein JRN62_02845 [Nitrososphaerota archaeon]|jgi:hypothetical protein|nr:hypothetical protein [Nitrososphaerota archaeon]MDG6948932.1 hypothetical protein [Nitrososphaerota archaeon]
MYQTKKKHALPSSISSCLICPQLRECIRCSAISRVDSGHPEKLRELVRSMIYRTPPTLEAQAAMDAGTEAHRRLEQARGVDTDPASVTAKIRDGQRFYWSLSICSVRYGLRGTVDAVLCDPQGRTLRLTVLDDKPHFSTPYMRQIFAYAMILTDPNMLYTNPSFSEKDSVERKRFYDDIGFGDTYDTVEVWTTLNPYREGPDPDGVNDNPLAPRLFSKGNAFVNKHQVFAVLKAKKRILETYYNPGVMEAVQQTRFSARDAELLQPRL